MPNTSRHHRRRVAPLPLHAKRDGETPHSEKIPLARISNGATLPGIVITRGKPPARVSTMA
jgi:hypothetical protein